MELHHCFAKFEIPDNTLRCRWDRNVYFVEHTHDFWEFSIIIYGNYKQTLNNNVYNVHNNQALLISPLYAHKIFPGNPEDLHLNIVISCNFLKEVCGSFSSDLYDKLLNATPSIVHLSNSKLETIKDFTNKLEIIQNNPKEKILVKKILLTFIIDLVYETYFLNTYEYPLIVKQFIELISIPENLMLPINDLIAQTNYSYSHFFKLFKQSTGMTIKEFLTNKKMEYAGFVLSRNEQPILELSQNLGFQSLSHFFTLFQKHYGVTPAKYRQQFHHK